MGTKIPDSLLRAIKETKDRYKVQLDPALEAEIPNLTHHEAGMLLSFIKPKNRRLLGKTFSQLHCSPIERYQIDKLKSLCPDMNRLKAVLKEVGARFIETLSERQARICISRLDTQS